MLPPRLDVLVSTRGDWPVTITVSATPDGDICKLVTTVCPTSSSIPSRVAVLKPRSCVVILNVPNPAGMPYLSGASLAQRQAAQRLAVGMTRTVVNPLAGSNMTVVDLMCDARSYLASTYSSDGLHPSDAGYSFIAAEVVRAMTTSNYPAPQATCAQMTIVP